METYVETILRGGRFKKMVTNQFTTMCKKYGLKRVEMEILIFLHKNSDKNTLKDISMYLEMNKGHISQAIGHLCREGYLTAKSDENDRRYVHFSIADKGELIPNDMLKIWDKMIQGIFEGITKEQMLIFQQVICRVNENMERILEEE